MCECGDWPRDLLYGVVRHLLKVGWSYSQVISRLPIGWGTVQRLQAAKELRYSPPPIDPFHDTRVSSQCRDRLAAPFPERLRSGKHGR